MRTDVVARSSGAAKLPPNVDGDGKTAKVKLKAREGDDMSTREGDIHEAYVRLDGATTRRLIAFLARCAGSSSPPLRGVLLAPPDRGSELGPCGGVRA